LHGNVGVSGGAVGSGTTLAGRSGVKFFDVILSVALSV